jgi:hypothetical protein
MQRQEKPMWRTPKPPTDGPLLEQQIADSKRLVEQSKEILARPNPILLGKCRE